MAATHAALMDRVYAPQIRIYDLTRRYYLIGRDRLIDELTPPPAGHVLELGCGTARNLIRAARRHPDCTFYGVDISNVMLDAGRRAVRHAGLARRIHLAQGDAVAFNPGPLFGRASFDRVFASYALSMIPDWPDALRHGLDLTAPDGRFHAVDFGQCENLPRPARWALFTWLRWFKATPRPDLVDLTRRFAEARGRVVRQDRLLRGYGWSLTVSEGAPAANA